MPSRRRVVIIERRKFMVSEKLPAGLELTVVRDGIDFGVQKTLQRMVLYFETSTLCRKSIPQKYYGRIWVGLLTVQFDDAITQIEAAT